MTHQLVGIWAVKSFLADCCGTTGGQPSARMLSSGLSHARCARSTQILTDLQQQGSNPSRQSKRSRRWEWTSLVSKQGHFYALVMQDYFTNWPKAIPLKDSTAKSVAGVLLSAILMWGPPAELLSNQGPEFVAELNTCGFARFWLMLPLVFIIDSKET